MIPFSKRFQEWYLPLSAVDRLLAAISIIVGFYIVAYGPYVKFLFSPGIVEYGLVSLPSWFFGILEVLLLAIIAVVLFSEKNKTVFRILLFCGHYLLYTSSPFTELGWFYLCLCLHLQFLIIKFLRLGPEKSEWLAARHLDLMFSILYLSVILYRLNNPSWFNGDALYYILSGNHSRLGFLTLDKDSIFLRVISLVSFYLEVAFISLIILPEKFRRMVYYAIIAFHIGLELFLTEELWNFTVIALVLTRLSLKPKSIPSGKVLYFWGTFAILQLFIAFPYRYIPVGMQSVRLMLGATRLLEPLFIRGFNMYQFLPGKTYNCPVYVSARAGKINWDFGNHESCRQPRFRWWLHPSVSLLRIPDKEQFLKKNCEENESDLLGIILVSKEINHGAKEEIKPAGCWDCKKNLKCAEEDVNRIIEEAKAK